MEHHDIVCWRLPRVFRLHVYLHGNATRELNIGRLRGYVGTQLFFGSALHHGRGCGAHARRVSDGRFHFHLDATRGVDELTLAREELDKAITILKPQSEMAGARAELGMLDGWQRIGCSVV